MKDLKSLHVLLLEDQALVRAGMRALIQLCEPGATIIEAGDYKQALEQLGRVEVDIAFLDIDLKAQQSGIDVLQHIRLKGMSTRAVMLSGKSDPDLVMECLRQGACGYILKDTEGEGVFRRALDVIFAGQTYLPASIAGLPAPADPTELESLGVRGRALEALYYLCQGLPNQLIAERMGVAESTVANEYNTRLFRLFRVTNRAGLIVEVVRRGVVVPPPLRRRE